MNYNLLEMIGLSGFDLTYLFIVSYALILILIIMVIVQAVKLSKLSKKYKKFMSGKNAKSLEKDIIGLYEDNRFIKASTEKNKSDIRFLYKKLASTFQKVGIVKYDAFNEMGGKLSFAVAMLDNDNSGWILNAMHSREGCYTYIKEIIDGNSIIALAEEEKEALDMAMSYYSKEQI